jgi:hypothetical protein
VSEPEQDREVTFDESPFEVPPTEGIPFDDGSAEDEAIRRVIDRASLS